MVWQLAFAFLALLNLTTALPYDPDEVAYNINQNQNATKPQEYSGGWENHTYHPSPNSWRFPFYTLTLDRYVDGDPTNNEANGTLFEHNWMTNQFRFGGDLIGLQNDLDYIQGMGIKSLYLTGSPFINTPWAGDGYGPLDFTLLDHHHGEIQDWQNLVTEIHNRDMYIILDNTLATMGDLIAFKEYENASAPFDWHEYDFMWKSDRIYFDFEPGSEQNASCQYPVFWDETGYLDNITANFDGCRASEFDQYGDMEGVGSYPSWQSQLSKFASVQDRLRAWAGSSTLDKINVMSCIQIAMFDIDGFRIDKGLQTTVDALAEFSDYQRACARDHGKENFLIVGEVVGQIPLASIYIGRGKTPNHIFTNITQAMLATNETASDNYVREFGNSALDGQAFHYPTYGAMTRFLGLDGPIGFEGVDFVDHWNKMLGTDDMVNPNTGEFDPRHMFGMSNQDVFRWPSLAMGTQRNLLGLFITTLEMPGIPTLFFGEEQEYYVLENMAPNYVYGRTPMASARAWQLHGCYNLGELVYVDMPFNSSATGCHDDSVSLDHRDPSHPLRNILKRMYEIRRQFPVLNDGYALQTLSSQFHNIYLPGSDGLPSPTGIWSVYRGRAEGIQDLAGSGQGNQGAWFIYHNENSTIDYSFDCGNESLALISAFPANTTVKALFYPYEEYTLDASTVTYGIEGSAELNGCLPNLTMSPYEFKAFVPKSNWSTPAPTIVKIIPSHDMRLQSSVSMNETETVDIEIRFSSEMSCESVTNSLQINSTTFGGQLAQLDTSSVSCQNATTDLPQYVAEIATAWIFTAKLVNVGNGVHEITVNNASTADGLLFTNARDHFKFRIGQPSNPMVFPMSGNYSYNLLHSDEETGDLYISSMAPGADKFRYSLNWGSSWSNWTDYSDANYTLQNSQPWSGTKLQEWSGDHVIVNYWSMLTGSSEHIQHGDLNRGDLPPRRWPHVFAQGPWNQYGYDSGLPTQANLDTDGLWKFKLMAEWPSKLVLNVWGMNPDGFPDKTQWLGDVDGDNVLDWLPPDTLSLNVVNVSKPAMPFLGVTIVANDGNYGYSLVPVGSVWNQLILAIVLAVAPIISAAAAIFIFRKSFYRVKFNEIGLSEKTMWAKAVVDFATRKKSPTVPAGEVSALALDSGAPSRRTVLLATMEYEIEDWNIKIKIGGLGVMSSLMGKNLGHQDIIWVVPCVGDVEYPVDQPGDVMTVIILGQTYEIEVQYHTVRNITYVLLDAPIFRKQTKAEPYPARMDDLDSAVYYSAWNTCIAKAMILFNADLYHINDYHGALAPLHLLPRTIPVCLSLHNAEFQGLWPLRNPKELEEICKVFNLEKSIVQNYVQFGEVFNLLHAAASYLRIHQNGFGAVGVSKKYGKRSFARYPIFWGLNQIGSLPNPDPSDTAEWSGTAIKQEAVVVDEAFEAERGNLRRQAQEWAGLDVDPNAELFVFVGRWSQQKGIDLIADVFFSILEEFPRAQLICIGPVIDLYGKFAALKLSKMMEKYPTRVFSKPEFTALPPFIFSGAEFALIPSRDEPFGLVAVEFGRKGALGVGARVGGLGNMPGWWFTVESITTKHLLGQLKNAIRSALASSKEVRAIMRHRSSLQRFPVAQWVGDLETLQTTSIQIHKKQASKQNGFLGIYKNSTIPTTDLPPNSILTQSAPASGVSTAMNSTPNTRPPSIHEGSVFEYQTVANQQLNSPLASPAPSIRPPFMSPANTSPNTPVIDTIENPFEHPSIMSKSSSLLSLHAVAGLQPTFGLQNVDPTFTDPGSVYYDSFERMLGSVDGKTSEDKYCIEKYLTLSEKRWFGQRHNAKLRRTRPSTPSTPGTSIFGFSMGRTGENDSVQRSPGTSINQGDFLLGDDYTPPTGIKKFLQKKIGDWQIYSLLLALGQIIAANSYQITLLTGENGQSADKLYVVSSIYLGASLCWWIIYRKFASVYVLSLPFIFYGLAFFLLGMAPYVNSTGGRGWMYNVATGLYSVASASGSFFFALNFGDEGGAPVQSWVLRACIIQGTQQIYVAALWYWGATQTKLTSEGSVTSSQLLTHPVATAITTPIAVFLWACGLAIYFGLPKYYRQTPGRVPSFYTSLLRRKIVLWFLVVVILQNYWTSSITGRNWQYLWSSSYVPAWGIAILVVVFFVGVWALMLWLLGSLTRQHSWILPIFAIGLGCPRWCQILWGTSGIGLYIPWGGNIIGALLGRSLWAWLGVLDAIQGVGIGVILLQTLTRVHIACALVAAQVIGSLATIAGRATSPTRVGPGDVFPNFAWGVGDTLNNASFWVALACQGVICVGFFAFFRKEQLSKP